MIIAAFPIALALATLPLASTPAVGAAGPVLPDTIRISGPSAGLTCDPPIRWRIDELDERFGLTAAEAASAVSEAAGLWERALGQDLFVHDPEDGFPISFVFDARHQMMQDRMEREATLTEHATGIREGRAELDGLHDELRVQRELHRERLTTLEARQAEHRRAVAYWEARGGPPAAEARELDRVEEELRRERRLLNEKGDAINALAARVNEMTEVMNERISEYNRAQSALRGGADGGMLSGFYRESSRALGSWVLSRNREIEIYQFDDPDHLLRAIAHELGHALGLGYSSEPTAIMYQHARSARMSQRGLGGAQLHPADVELLTARCRP